MTPKCPNHVVPMQRTNEKRIWICPISGARFEADSEDQENEKKIDKLGNPVTEIKLTPLDGVGG